jgi:hypothetical protein
MPRTPLGWALTIGLPALAVAIALALAGGGNSGPDVEAEASAVCGDAQRALAQLHPPRSLSDVREFDHGMLALLRQELSQLQELAPRAGESFRAGLADEWAIQSGLSSMVARPDFIELSLTLPDHPNLAPRWATRWHARERALLADAQRRFSQAGIPACEKSLG